MTLPFVTVIDVLFLRVAPNVFGKVGYKAVDGGTLTDPTKILGLGRKGTSELTINKGVPVCSGGVVPKMSNAL